MPLFYLLSSLLYIDNHFSTNSWRSSLTIAMTVGTLVGSMIPLFMNKLNIDPAVASGPFITTINDIVSMLIYFGLATTFMSYLT